VSLVLGPYLRKPEVHCAGNAVEFDDLLALYVGAVGSKFPCQGRFNEGNPLCGSLCLISWDGSATVGALDHYASPFAAFAAAA
jgi:hypothetical protein